LTTAFSLVAIIAVAKLFISVANWGRAAVFSRLWVEPSPAA
jgi:hypothetical protein